MIQYNNINNWKEIHYQGHSIKEAYSSLGLVWSAIPPMPKWIATYSDSHTESASCDSSSAIAQDEITLADLVSVEIGSCITSIGDGAFAVCTSLASVTIPDSVTSIGSYAFTDCSGLISVTIPSGVTSIGNGAFDGCTGLTSVNIPSGVTTISTNTFQKCSGLTSIDIPNSVTTIGTSAFRYCRSLTSITIPDSVTVINGLTFNDCTGLTSVTIGSGITNIGKNAFNNCKSLTSITINATKPPILAYGAFDNTKNCPIYVPCQSVDAYKSAWSTYASRIQCIEPPTPTGTKFQATYSDSTTFSAVCDGDSTLTVETTQPSGHQHSAMTSAVIGDCITTIGWNALNGCRSLTSVTIPNSVTVISGDAFDVCTSLSSITIPSGVTSIGEYAFKGCTSLTSITIEAVTPPTLGNYVFWGTPIEIIYVPAQSVSTYQSASGWSTYSNIIQAI